MLRSLVGSEMCIRDRDGFGHTALWTAARERRFTIAVSLLCGGATVRPSPRAASLPVFAASRLSCRRTDITQLLIVAGADDVNNDAQSLLARLLAPGRHSVIRILLAACHVTVPPGHVTHDDVIDSLLVNYSSEPASLTSQCRWTIRRVVSRAMDGRHFLTALSRLPLPRSLVDYLSLVDHVTHCELIENDLLSWSQLVQYMTTTCD